MPDYELPATVDANQVSLPACDAPQSTTAPETETSREATPGLDLRGYELVERLGGGGMGDVYRAGDPALGRDLAVKVMKAQLQGYAAAENRFVREARVTGSLQHPGIVPIHNLGRLADGRLHYTMRLVRGQTLADILKEKAGRPECLPELLTIFEKICQAVAYAHSKQVIHRDLKPANVMVGRFGEVQVMDWGLAKLLASGEQGCASAPTEELSTPKAEEEASTRIYTEAGETPTEQTHMGREMGTPAYMPPEQALGEWYSVDERADVFALGTILCQILTGQPPYTGRDGMEVLRKAKRGDLTEALKRLEGCGADVALVGLCRECLAPVREGRPRDAEQVAQRVAAYQAEVQERLRHAELERATAVVKAAGERKKRRWMGTAMSLLLAGALVSTWQMMRATKAESRAQENEGRARENEGQALKAAEAERQAKDLAHNRLGQIEKANEVLTSIFRDLDPRAEDKGGPSLRQQLGQHLERAATQLDEESVGDPVAVARLQIRLGKSLTNLGQVKAAIEVLNKSGMTLEDRLGPDHPDTLTCRTNLAAAYWTAGRTADAIRLYEQTLKQQEAKLGSDHPDTLTCRNNLALAFKSAGRTTEAIRLYEQTLKQREAKLGPDHPDTLQSRSNLASTYQSAGRTAEGIRLNEKVLKQQEAKLGPDHPDTLQSRNNLAGAYWSVGRTAEAIRLFEQTLRQTEAKFGADHPNTLTTGNNLATAYRSAGRIAEAIRLSEQTLKQTEAKLGPDHPNALQFRINLALAYKSAGRLADAIRLYEQNLKLSEVKCGADHPTTLQTMANLGAGYLEAARPKDSIPLLEKVLERGRQRPDGVPASLAWVPVALAHACEQDGQWGKAEAVCRDALEQAKRQFGSDDPRTAGPLTRLGLNLLKQKKFTDAEPLLRQASTIFSQKQPAEWTTFNARSALGEALLGQKKYAEAEPLLLQGYEGMKQRQDKIPLAQRQIRLPEALEGLVRLYEATGQKEKAADWRKKLAEAKAAQKKAKS